MIIKIKNLRLQTILGVYEWEKTIDRDIIINAEITSDKLNSLESDNIEDTIDYDILISKIKTLITNNRFKLIEAMAQSMIKLIMEDKRISKCKLEIDKVGVVEGVDSFSVTIEQLR
jgi:dihydroneopterin aldolase